MVHSQQLLEPPKYTYRIGGQWQAIRSAFIASMAGRVKGTSSKLCGTQAGHFSKTHNQNHLVEQSIHINYIQIIFECTI